MSLAISLNTKPETFCFCIDRVGIGEQLNWIALQLYKPVHRCSEILIRSLVTPIRPGEEGNYDSAALEKVRRVVALFFYGLLALALLPLYFCGIFIDKLGDCLTNKSYTYLQGLAPEKIDLRQAYSFLQLNGCMFWGGLPYLFGGCSPANERIDKTAELILQYNPDFVIMEEVLFEAGLKFKEKLENEYAHFYTRIGPNPLRMETGLFIASKYAIKSQPRFISYPEGNKGGFFCLETSSFWVIAAHLNAGSEEDSKRIRKLQLETITMTIHDLKNETGKPCFLLGDLNIKRTGEKEDEYASSGISESYYDRYKENNPELNEESATCTNLLTAHRLGKEEAEEPWEIDDYALIDKESADQFKLESQLIPTFSMQNPHEALSDHRALLFTATLK